MSKRKPRKKLINKLDLLKPISVEQFGTQDDPCFGKLYDLRADECKRCGDCEICAIAMGQKLILKRTKIEEESNFKDIEELEIKSKLTRSELRKEIRKYLKKGIQDYGEKGANKRIIIDYLFNSFKKDGVRRSHIKRIINKLISVNKIKINKNNNLIWNQ